MDTNLVSLIAFPEILAGLGVRRWVLQSQIEYTSRLQFESLGEGASQAIELIREAAAHAGVNISWTMPDRLDLELNNPDWARHIFFEPAITPEAGTRKCTQPWEIPYVDKDGRVFPCCFASTRRSEVLGDLRVSPFAQVWEGELYRKFRLDMLDSATTPAVCRSCKVMPLVDVHPYRFWAEIVPEASNFDDAARVVVVARNTGSVTWTRETPVHIGTSMPHDRESELFHDSWLSRNRAAHFVEEEVPPGELATFQFCVSPKETRHAEAFELVVDSVRWLPATCFEIPPKSETALYGHEAILERIKAVCRLILSCSLRIVDRRPK